MRFRSDPTQIRGSIVPVITPFTVDGAVDVETLRRLIEWQIENGSHGISVNGTTGEPAAQTLDEREAIMEIAATSVADRVPFVPATGGTNVGDTLRLTAAADRIGADAVLIVVPVAASQQGFYDYFAMIARQFSHLPIIIYNIPQRVGASIDASTVARLRRAHANIVGLKDSVKDFEHPSQILQECGRDFLLYCGFELLSFPLLTIGAAGQVNATANLLPVEVAMLYNLAVEQRWQEAADMHFTLMSLSQALFFETHPGPLKWAMARVGRIPHGGVRLPLVAPSEANQIRIANILAAYPQLAVTPS
jgi:4-hydroxy-tetrahydrodipicolinate synthase